MALTAQSPTIEPVARLMLFVRRPYSLSEAEAARWMREQAAPLATANAERVELSRLQAPPLHGGADCEWLVEIHFRRGEEAARAARHEACRELVADLRLLGMQPRLVVADGTEPLEG